jgi:hypothetical protein
VLRKSKPETIRYAELLVESLGGRNASDLHRDLLRDMRSGDRVHADGRLVYADGRWL